MGGDAARLRDILDSAWNVASNGTSDVSSLDSEAAAFGPTNDEEWVFDMGYAQNGAAAVAYAIRTWLTDDAQEAVWAGRQVQEAAEYSVSQADLVPGEMLVREVSDLPSVVDINSSAAMQSVVAFLNQALGICEERPPSWRDLKDLARSTGQAWEHSFR